MTTKSYQARIGDQVKEIAFQESPLVEGHGRGLMARKAGVPLLDLFDWVGPVTEPWAIEQAKEFWKRKLEEEDPRPLFKRVMPRISDFQIGAMFGRIRDR